MRKIPVRVLLVGVAAAILVVAMSYGYTVHLESKLDDLVTKCEEEGKATISAFSKVHLLCDPDQLAEFESGVGTQADIVATKQSIERVKNLSVYLAIAVILTSAVPLAWYFLLARIRELREALIGK